MGACVRPYCTCALRAYAGHGYACDDETRRVGAGRDRLVVQAGLGFGSGVVVVIEGFLFLIYCYVCIYVLQWEDSEISVGTCLYLCCCEYDLQPELSSRLMIRKLISVQG